MEVKKNEHTFYVKGDYSEKFFSRLHTWERNTFYILEHYKTNKESIYIDIGAWIGPTVLYSANIYNKIIAIEPDPIAIERFKQNLNVNNFNNITLIEKGLSNKNGKTIFGGNGNFGNSQSTLLVADKDYMKYGSHSNWNQHQNDITEIETITMETLLEEQNINAENISLIKMDIEGGELILIPHLKNFLQKYKPAFYISLHYVFLNMEHIKEILNILFQIYEKCFYFDNNGNKKIVTKDYILRYKITTLVFE